MFNNYKLVGLQTSLHTAHSSLHTVLQVGREEAKEGKEGKGAVVAKGAGGV